MLRQSALDPCPGLHPLPLEGPATPETLPEQLCFADESLPGLRRRRYGKRYHYYDIDGERIRDEEDVRRINALAIPPAWQEVWICADRNGHLQATGRDARGRKQYRYHPLWRELRDCSKYGRLLAFGEALPRIRRQAEQHLQLPGLGRDKLLASALTLLDQTLIRVGNRRYAQQNRSYGLTTLRTRHVSLTGSAIRLRFRGKSGVEHQVTLRDARLARIIRRCLELPGQELFQYLDDQGERRSLSSGDINEYLRQLAGADFSAKDYRTWAGSALALALLRGKAPESDTQGRKVLAETVKEVARQLRNTPAVCRSCYIHPLIVEAYLQGRLAGLGPTRQRRWLDASETLLVRFLQSETAPETYGQSDPVELLPEAEVE